MRSAQEIIAYLEELLEKETKAWRYLMEKAYDDEDRSICRTRVTLLEEILDELQDE